MGVAAPAIAQSNAELARIVAEDQKDRANQFQLTKAERKAVFQRDVPRRQRVGELMRSGALKTGEDFERAALVFQHGATLRDFELAHVLAMTASAVEPGRGRWLAAASFDRLISFLHQPEVFGLGLAKNVRIDRDLLPDTIRELNCVPSLATREQQLREIAEKKTLTTPGPCGPRVDLLMGRWALTLRHPDGSFSQAVLEFIGTVDSMDTIFTEGGKSSDLEDMGMGENRLHFRVGERGFEVVLNGDEMTGTFTAAGGATGRVLGLVSRAAGH